MRLLDRITTRAGAGDANRQAVTELYFQNGREPERLLVDFQTYVNEGLRGSSPIYALIAVRALAFAEARFAWRNRSTKRIFGNQALRRLERPSPTLATRDLLAQIEVDISAAGNAYVRAVDPPAAREPGARRMRPDWCEIVKSRNEYTGLMDLLGLVYWEGGKAKQRPVYLDVDEFFHVIDIPDPLADFRGESWITAAARAVDSHTYATRHKAKFFTNAATPNFAIVTEQELSPEAIARLQSSFEAKFASWENAYKTVLLEGGADVKTLGNTFEQMTFSTIQGHDEVSMAADAGVPPVVVGFLQGIQAATYSNYSQAMRRFADLTIRPKWKSLVGSAASIMDDDTPDGSELWYDDRDVPFLQQDAKDASDIRFKDAQTIRQLTDAGFTPDSAVAAVETGDFTQLEHSGLYSVQLQPAGSGDANDNATSEGDTNDEDQ